MMTWSTFEIPKLCAKILTFVLLQLASFMVHSMAAESTFCLHLYIHICPHSMDPLVCHKDSRMWNKSRIHIYMNLQCKIAQTFYQKKTVL